MPMNNIHKYLSKTNDNINQLQYDTRKYVIIIINKYKLSFNIFLFDLTLDYPKIKSFRLECPKKSKMLLLLQFLILT